MLEVFLVLFVLLQIADGVSTHIGLNLGLREQNKVVACLIEKLGLTPALLFAKGSAATLGLLLYLNPPMGYALIPVTVLYAWVVKNNVRFLMGLRSKLEK